MTELQQNKAELQGLKQMRAEVQFVAAEAGYKKQKPKFPVYDHEDFPEMERTMKSNSTFANIVVS